MNKRRIAFPAAASRISTITVMVSTGTVEFIDAGFIELTTLFLVCESIDSTTCSPIGTAPITVYLDQEYHPDQDDNTSLWTSAA